MKKTTAPKKTKITRTTKSTSAKHQTFLKVYWPYLPLFILVFFGLIFGVGAPGGSPRLSQSGVLAYATEMSSSGLLSATNTQRSQNGGLAPLTLNSKLSAAAQSKANDMIARNYWSHNTPDGKEPWVFIEAANYEYQKAGENLAYGFSSSSDTVTGWMNSTSHRANILDDAYREVGFGFANANDYVSTGQETIVVAMYGNPAAAPSVAVTVSNSAPANAGATKSAAVKAASANSPASQPTTVNEDTVEPTKAEVIQPNPVTSDRVNQAINSDSPVPASQPATRITKLQSITRGYAPWSAAALSGGVPLVTLLWALKHALIVKRVLVDGENFLLHHPLLDVGVMSLVAFAILLSRSSGVVK